MLDELERATPGTMRSVAAHLGPVRLMDNLLLEQARAA